MQPIELLWARIKGRIAKCYSTKTSLKDVRERLTKEFEDLSGEKGHDVIAAIIDHVDLVIKKFLVETQLEEDVHENDIENLTLTASSCSYSSLRTITSCSETSLEPKQ